MKTPLGIGCFLCVIATSHAGLGYVANYKVTSGTVTIATHGTSETGTASAAAPNGDALTDTVSGAVNWTVDLSWLGSDTPPDTVVAYYNLVDDADAYGFLPAPGSALADASVGQAAALVYFSNPPTGSDGESTGNLYSGPKTTTLGGLAGSWEEVGGDPNNWAIKGAVVTSGSWSAYASITHGGSNRSFSSASEQYNLTDVEAQ